MSRRISIALRQRSSASTVLSILTSFLMDANSSVYWDSPTTSKIHCFRKPCLHFTWCNKSGLIASRILSRFKIPWGPGTWKIWRPHSTWIHPAQSDPLWIYLRTGTSMFPHLTHDTFPDILSWYHDKLKTVQVVAGIVCVTISYPRYMRKSLKTGCYYLTCPLLWFGESGWKTPSLPIDATIEALQSSDCF